MDLKTAIKDVTELNLGTPEKIMRLLSACVDEIRHSDTKLGRAGREADSALILAQEAIAKWRAMS